MKFNNLCDIHHSARGHSKSTFVEEGGGWGSLKSEQKQTEGEGILACVYVRFFNKIVEIFEVKIYSYSPVFPIDYNVSMKY